MGRRQVTVWCEGYHSPAILTESDLIDKIAYVYAKPMRAHLGDYSEPFPVGLFPPCQPILANLLPAFVRNSLAPV